MGGCDYEAKRFSVPVGESESYRDNYDRIFGKREEAKTSQREFTLVARLVVDAGGEKTDAQWEEIRSRLQAGLLVVAHAPTEGGESADVHGFKASNIKVFLADVEPR